MKNEEIIEQVIEELNVLGIINKPDVCFAEAKRSEYAYVINDTNYYENLQTVKSYLTSVGIDLLGRFAEFKYLSMDGCVENATKYMKNQY